MGGNPIIGGSAMAVLLGVGLLIGPWFSGEALSFVQKFLLSGLGGILVVLGVAFSKS